MPIFKVVPISRVGTIYKIVLCQERLDVKNKRSYEHEEDFISNPNGLIPKDDLEAIAKKLNELETRLGGVERLAHRDCNARY